jgi:hypothetical protein
MKTYLLLVSASAQYINFKVIDSTDEEILELSVSKLAVLHELAKQMRNKRRNSSYLDQ